MSDVDPRILEGRAVFEAEMVRATSNLHTRVLAIEARVGAGLGVGDDSGKLGKVTDDARRANKAIATAIAVAIAGFGTAVQALRTSASEDGAALSRLSTLERDVDRLERSIRSLLTVTAPRLRVPGDLP